MKKQIAAAISALMLISTTAVMPIEMQTGINTATVSAKSAKVSIKAAKLTIKKSKYAYTGKSRKPAVTVKLGGKTLKKDKDYTVSYKNNKNIGTATVTVKGKDSYTGSCKKTFRIVPKKVTGVKTSSVKKTSGKLSWTKVKNAGGYKIYQYNSKTKKYKCIKTIKKAATSCTVKGLRSGTTYKFKVRAYKTVNGKTYAGFLSDVVKIKTKNNGKYSDWDKALAAWAIGDISASQRKMITDKLNKYTAEYAKSYPFKMKQSDDVVPFRENGTGKVLEKLTWDEQWNNFAEGVGFSDGSSFADTAPYYYQGYMTYDKVLSEARWSYDDMMNYKLKDSFEDGRLEAGCAGNYDVTIEYNWAFYEDTDVSESYTSQSGHEVHAWCLVFCSKIP